MPKVYLTETDRRNARVAAWAYSQMKLQRIKQKSIAEKIGITPQALSQKLKNQSFNLDDFAVFVREFQPSDRELRELIS